MDANHLYKDIQARTKGEIYIGVVGPVRTGKSTFIKRFMEILVLPHMTDEPDKARTREYGGSGVGLSIVKAIMESMNQKYGVINYNNGVEFWFELETK